MSRLVICEKPSVAQGIGKVLGATGHRDGYLEGGGYVVSWCVGHLVEPAEPEAYDERFAKWNRDDLPILPEHWKYRVTAATKKQFDILRSLMQRDDVESLVNGCDAGREGELIFRLVYHQCGCRKPFERLWISSMEDAAIREGFENLKPSSGYDALYEAALCRERADWLVGINATRLFSCLYGQTLNVGRVMTPTLAMVVLREKAIRGFTPEPFYTVRIVLDGLQAGGERMKGRDEAGAVAEECRDAGKATVTKAERKERSEGAPALYDLTTLQRDANRQLGFTAQQTLDHTQSLYEKKFVTYPRTDSRYLTDDMAGMLPGLVEMVQKRCGIAPDLPASVNAAQVTNSAKVSDHHAIIPTRTLEGTDLSELPQGEKDVLMLIAARLIAAVAEPYRYLETDIELDCAGHVFKTKGRTVLSPGWKAFVGKADEKEQDEDPEAAGEIPALREQAELPLVSAEVREGRTSPPRHFTEDLLLSAMETAGADGIPEEDRVPAEPSGSVGEGGAAERSGCPPEEGHGEAESAATRRRGIGTPATRAGIIEKLVRKGFMERKGGQRTKILVPTAKGEALVTVVPEQIRSPSMTAEWEEKLLQIERGGCEPERFMEEITGMVSDLVRNTERVQGADALSPPKGTVIGRCPACGADVLERQKGYFCSDEDCHFALWKDNRYLDSIGKTLTSSIAEKLLTDGRVRLKGCRSARTGRTFDAVLVLSADEGGRARFSMEPGHTRKAGGTKGEKKS